MQMPSQQLSETISLLILDLLVDFSIYFQQLLATIAFKKSSLTKVPFEEIIVKVQMVLDFLIQSQITKQHGRLLYRHSINN